jgi:hypothetical protein
MLFFSLKSKAARQIAELPAIRYTQIQIWRYEPWFENAAAACNEI